MKKLTSFLLLIVLLVAFSIPAFANTDAGISAFIEQIENAKMQELGVDSIQELVDELSKKPAAGSEWWILTIRNYHEKLDYSLYRDALDKYVKETPPSSASSKERIALALVSLDSKSSYPEEILDGAIETGALNTYIFGLHLIKNGKPSKYTQKDIVDTILSMQASDGGWSLNGKTPSDPDMTAMVLQALASNSDEKTLNDAIFSGLSFLSSVQLENGGYKTYGNENPETPAQVLMALSSLGIDAKTDERFIKNGNTLFDAIESYKISDGVYAHTKGGDANATAQVQVYYSYVSYEMYKNNGQNFYVFEPLSEQAIKRDNKSESSGLNLKLILYIAIAVLVLASCAFKFFKGERKAKSYISILLVGIVLALLVTFIKLESTNEHYKKSDLKNPIYTTISIYCDTIKGSKDYIPSDGKILEFKPIQVEDGANVYQQLVECCKEYKLQMESEGEGYIRSINNIYEYDFGELSGWMFKVNGEFSSVGCDQAKLKDGDYVEWVYTTNLGKDVGNDYNH